MTAQTPPGWYDDPDGSTNAQRRWDGHAWTPERRRKSAQLAPQSPSQQPGDAQGPYPQSVPQSPYQQPGDTQGPYPQSVPQPPYQQPGNAQDPYSQSPYQQPGGTQGPFPQSVPQPPYQQPGNAQDPYSQSPYQQPGGTQGPFPQSPYQQPGNIQGPYPQSPYQQPGTAHTGASTAASNVLSIIAFVCAGVSIFLLPAIFGIAGLILGVVALTKKERLAPYAIAAAAVGLIVGWLIEAVLWKSGFY